MKSDLEKIAEAIYEKSASKMEAHTRRVKRIRSQVANLNEAKRVESFDQSLGRTDFNAEFRIRWHQWIEEKVGKLNEELARELSNRPKIVAQTKKGFGRMQAMKRLATTQKLQELASKNRRIDYES